MPDPHAFDRWARVVHLAAIIAAFASLIWVGMQVTMPVLFGLYPVGIVLGVALARALSDLLDRRHVRRAAGE